MSDFNQNHILDKGRAGRVLELFSLCFFFLFSSVGFGQTTIETDRANANSEFSTIKFTSPDRETQVPKIGDAGPAESAQTHDIRLQDVKGDNVTLREVFKQQAQEKDVKLIVIELWGSWCKPCVGFLPHMAKIHDKYRAKGVRVIGVAVEDNADTFDAFLKKHPSPYPQFFDIDREVYKSLGKPNFPRVFIITPDGKVIANGNPFELLMERTPENQAKSDEFEACYAAVEKIQDKEEQQRVRKKLGSEFISWYEANRYPSVIKREYIESLLNRGD